MAVEDGHVVVTVRVALFGVGGLPMSLVVCTFDMLVAREIPQVNT